ncbi:MAG TPA: methyltransferase domain-containing protein [Pseudonocardiaceae bacterium]|jgi:SAM-dependent methyltransferase|nr:methyltransferase domain-containing protein [Pseudonocardiaceae bacterium]
MRASAVHRALEIELVATRRRLGGAPRVLDVGGGSGVWAVPLARAGCTVTVVDTSPDALATLRHRAGEAGVTDRITAVQGDADNLGDAVPAASADLVLGHGILEVVDDVRSAVVALAAAAAPGGAVSVLVANRHAAVLGRALAGRLVEARTLLEDPDGRFDTTDPLLRRFTTIELVALLEDSSLAVERLQGDGVLSDLVPGSVLEAHPGAAEQLSELELAAAGHAPLRDIASRLHALARRG